MPFKGIFNQKNQRDHTRNNKGDLESQILRINALEVQIKKLLESEKQLRASMYGTGRGDKKGDAWQHGKNKVNDKNQIEDRSKERTEIQHKINLLDQKMNKLTGRINNLEQFDQDMIPLQKANRTNSLSLEERVVEADLVKLVEQLLSEKLALHMKREEKMYEKIRALESQITKLLKYENNNEPEDESIYSQIEMRLLALEHNFILVNEVQAGLLKRMDELIERYDELTKLTVETEEIALQQESIFKTLYIDKLYLEKYEQNNNFAQLGINSLNGTLNIGATYGKDAVPIEVTEQVKEEMAKVKAVKEEMDKNKTSANKTPDLDNDESATQNDSIPAENDMPYTDIMIEEDPSLGEESF